MGPRHLDALRLADGMLVLLLARGKSESSLCRDAQQPAAARRGWQNRQLQSPSSAATGARTKEGFICIPKEVPRPTCHS